MTSTMNREQIQSLIPHRDPFLFVKEVVSVNATSITTTAYADPEADFFRGHYPDHPVMPGVLLSECCFQSGALLLANRPDSDIQNRIPVLTRIQDAKFKQIVHPGQTLTIEVTLDEKVDEAFFMTGKMTTDGKLVMRVSFTVMMVPWRERGL